VVFRALLLDAYRQLSAAKLFWLTLGLSAIVVLVFGSIGFNDEGMSLFFGLTQIESEVVNAGSPWARGLYIGIYSSFLVTIWLGWIATVLALISTCTIFPEFVQGGSIELSLSKPISRLHLFFMKYAVSLSFVVLQVLLFCGGIFLCVGLRIGEWNWGIFYAIPIITVFYSYLFSVCVLVGMVTRSGITALLITGLFWMGLMSAQGAETVLNRFVTEQKVTIERLEEGIEKATEELAKLESESSSDIRIQRRNDRIESFQEDVDAAKVLFDKIDVWHQPVSWGLTALPKAGQTIGLLDRWLDDGTGFDIAALMRGDMQKLEEVNEFDPTTYGAREREAMRRLDEDYSERSLWYVVGTSLLFEGLILTLAAWYVCKKDF
jgi:hypothetical protein